MYNKNNNGPRTLPCGTPDTTSILEPHTIYLNFLSTTGQKILEHLQDHSINSSFPQFKHKALMINSVKGHTEINLDERKLSSLHPCLIPTDQHRQCPEEHHRYPNSFCMSTGELRKHPMAKFKKTLNG